MSAQLTADQIDALPRPEVPGPNRATNDVLAVGEELQRRGVPDELIRQHLNALLFIAVDDARIGPMERELWLALLADAFDKTMSADALADATP